MKEKQESFIIHNPLLSNFLVTLKDDPRYKTTIDSYTEKNFKASDTGQSYRTLNSWDNAGLLLNLPKDNNKWRKFSIVEILWIYIIKELRSIGFSKKKIQKLKDSLFPIDKKTGISNTERFSQYIISVVAETDVMLLVLPDGRGDFAIEVELIETEQKDENFPKTYTRININKLCAIFTKNPKYNKKNNFLYIPKRKELELIDKINTSEDLKEVELKIKDNKIDRINFKKQQQNPKAVISTINEAIAQGGRNEITLKLENGNIVYVEKIDKE